MTLESRRRYLSLTIVAILSLELVLIGEHMLPVQGLNRREAIIIKTILSALFLLKSKKPKFGILPIPLPLPIPLRIEQKEPPVYINKKHHKVPIVHNIPVPETYPEYYPVEEAPQYVDGGYEDKEYGGYGGGYGGY
ncbi:unnamed protein product [Medioppia subpectinata]|uniref:Uncharacterized protein n=1 Tax=Medioppia subpectinata TaxID=1979941 RepID=A0A7R9KNT4_9ACAR|nr:unnamed protein product [Medioppia subpectinata]CAG2106683.1 unnamed protein product [Medioppia subpectinata]